MRRLAGLVLVLCNTLPISPWAKATDRLHNLDALRMQASEHLKAQAAQAYPELMPRVQMGMLDPRLRLSHCPRPEFFFTVGSQAHGNGSLGVRCQSPGQWTLYLTYSVSLTGEVLVARRPLPARQALSPSDLELKAAELTQSPGTYFRSPDQLRGTVTVRPLAAGQPITLDMLKRDFAVRANQRVRIVAEGRGYRVSQEGTAQNTAYMGDTVRVKMPSGRIVQGVAEADGTVRMP